MESRSERCSKFERSSSAIERRSADGEGERQADDDNDGAVANGGGELERVERPLPKEGQLDERGEEHDPRAPLE